MLICCTSTNLHWRRDGGGGSSKRRSAGGLLLSNIDLSSLIDVGATSVSFLSYLVDLHMVLKLGSDPALSNAEMELDLPVSEELWNAESAEAWKELILRRRYIALPFHLVINALLTANSTSWSSPEGRLLRQLPSQSPFVLAILTNTLLALQERIASAQRVLETSTNTVACIAGMREAMDAARARGADGVEAIRRGLAVLSMAGADDSGRWFRGVAPLFK